MVKNMRNAYGWSLAEKKGMYYVWSRLTPDRELIWNLTKEDRPPTTGAGYPRREAILQVKGLQ